MAPEGLTCNGTNSSASSTICTRTVSILNLRGCAEHGEMHGREHVSERCGTIAFENNELKGEECIAIPTHSTAIKQRGRGGETFANGNGSSNRTNTDVPGPDGQAEQRDTRQRGERRVGRMTAVTHQPFARRRRRQPAVRPPPPAPLPPPQLLLPQRTSDRRGSASPTDLRRTD
jgi:hypothetical protein